MRRWGLVALLALVLAACAQRGPPKPQIRTVGVISAIGDVFYHETVSRRGTGSDDRTSPLQGLGIDEFAVAQAGAILGRRYQVRPVTSPSGAFAPDKIHFPGEQPAGGGRRRPIEEAVRTEAKPQGLDAYVVLTRGFVPFGGTQQIVRGLGVAKAEGIAEGHTYLHAVYWVTVIDGRSFKIIGDAKAPPLAGLPKPAGSGPEAILIDAPNAQAEPGFAGASLASLSNERRNRLRGALQKLIADSLPDALSAAKLLN